MITNTLLSWLDKYEKELVGDVLKLIGEDAPKNKFSIITGKLKMIEETKAQIDVIRRTES